MPTIAGFYGQLKNCANGLFQQATEYVQVSPLFQQTKRYVEANQFFQIAKNYVTKESVIAQNQPCRWTIKLPQESQGGREEIRLRYINNIATMGIFAFAAGWERSLVLIPIVGVVANMAMHRLITRHLTPEPLGHEVIVADGVDRAPVQIGVVNMGQQQFQEVKSREVRSKIVRWQRSNTLKTQVEHISNVGMGAFGLISYHMGLWSQSLFSAFAGPVACFAANMVIHGAINGYFKPKLALLERDINGLISRALPDAHTH